MPSTPIVSLLVTSLPRSLSLLRKARRVVAARTCRGARYSCGDMMKTPIAMRLDRNRRSRAKLTVCIAHSSSGHRRLPLANRLPPTMRGSAYYVLRRSCFHREWIEELGVRSLRLDRASVRTQGQAHRAECSEGRSARTLLPSALPPSPHIGILTLRWCACGCKAIGPRHRLEEGCKASKVKCAAV